MPPIVVSPYLKAPPGAVRTIAWTDAQGTPVPEELRGWDPTVDYSVNATVEMNPLEVLQHCRLPISTRLRLCVSWVSSGTSVRKGGEPVEIGARADALTLTAGVVAEGGLVSGTLDLTATVSLSESAPVASPVSAWRAGSILWEDRQQVLLSGSDGRFPIEWTGFSESREFQTGGAWKLDWSPEDLDVPAMAGIRLYLNSENRRVLDAVSAQPPSDSDGVILEVLHHDVARQLVTGILNVDEFGSREFEPSSIGAVILRLVTALFDNEPVSQIRQRMRDDQSRFDTELQGRLRFLAGTS